MLTDVEDLCKYYARHCLKSECHYYEDRYLNLVTIHDTLGRDFDVHVVELVMFYLSHRKE